MVAGQKELSTKFNSGTLSTRELARKKKGEPKNDRPISERFKHIRIPVEDYDRLGNLGTTKETYGDIIRKLMDYWEEGHKRKQ